MNVTCCHFFGSLKNQLNDLISFYIGHSKNDFQRNPGPEAQQECVGLQFEADHTLISTYKITDTKIKSAFFIENFDLT